MPENNDAKLRTLDLRERDVAIVCGILRAHLPAQAQVFVFGSRATGRAYRGSDLDLAVDAGEKLPFSLIAALRADFEESLLPITVDVVDLRAADPAFIARIERQFLPLAFSL